MDFEFGVMRVLEVGSGPGICISSLIHGGNRPENVTGTDLFEDRIAEARRQCLAAVILECVNAGNLKFANRHKRAGKLSPAVPALFAFCLANLGLLLGVLRCLRSERITAY